MTNAVYVNLLQTRISNVLMFSSHNQRFCLDCRQIIKIRGVMGRFIIDHLFAGLCCIESLEVNLEHAHAPDFLELAHSPPKRPALILLL